MSRKYHNSRTLFLYITRQYLFNFLIIIGGLLLLILFFDTLEILRRAQGRTDASFLSLLQLASFKLPQAGQEAFPFGVLFASMFTFWRLTRSHELVIARSVGLSVWQFIMPVITTTFIIGMVLVGLINPIGAAFMSRYEQLEDRLIKGRAYTLDVAESGLWLREEQETGITILSATNINMENLILRNVVIYYFDNERNFQRRLDANRAELKFQEDGSRSWFFQRAWESLPDQRAREVHNFSQPTNMNIETIEDSFSAVEAISFWTLPAQISRMEQTGFSALRLKIYFQTLLARPLFLAALILIAAIFSLRQPRRGGTLIMIAGGVGAGFALYLLTNIITALGLTESIPIFMAAWLPPILIALTGCAALLYLEDG